MSVIKIGNTGYEYVDSFKNELGSGAFGDVYKGYLSRHPELEVAVKVLRGRFANVEKEFVDRMLLLGESNPYVVKFFCTAVVDTGLVIVLEMCSGGDLAAFIRSGCF